MKRGNLSGVKTTYAKPLEQRLREAMTSKEPIQIDATQGTYTQASQGTLAEHDIRTDRQLLAIEAIEKVREYRMKKEKSVEGETLKE